MGLMPGAVLEPEWPQGPGNVKCLPATFRYISILPAKKKMSVTEPIFPYLDAMGCDGCVIYLSLEHPAEGLTAAVISMVTAHRY